MKLTGIDCQIPSRRMGNENIVELVEHYSAPHNNDDKLKELEVLIKKLLFKTGINSRYWRKKNEKPINLIVQSIENALKMSNFQKQNINLVIYSRIKVEIRFVHFRRSGICLYLSKGCHFRMQV